MHIDDDLTDQNVNAVALDKVDSAARETLLGTATERSKSCLGSADFQRFMTHIPSPPKFYYGGNADFSKG
jgi:hypothetical protein